MPEPTKYEAFLRLETGTHTTRINQLLVTRDSKILVSAGEKTIRVWDVETRRQLRMLLGEIGAGTNGSIQRIALSPDDKVVVALAWLNPDGTHGENERVTDVRTFELSTGNLQARFRYPGMLQDVDFSPDGRFIAFVGNRMRPDQRACLEVFDTGAVLEGLGTTPSPLASDVLSEQNSGGPLPLHVRFVPGDQDEATGLRIVVASFHQHPQHEPQYTGRLSWYSFSPKGGLQKLAASRETEENVAPRSLAVSRDFVVATGDVKKVFCHDHTGKLVATILSESVPAAPVFSGDGTRLIVGQSSEAAPVEVSVYDVALGQFRLRSTYHGHDSEVAAVAFLRNGTAISAGGDQNAIHFWNPSHFEGEQSAVIKGVGRVVHAVGIDADEQIAIGNYDDLRSEDGTVLLQRVFKLRSMSLQGLSIHDAAAFERAQTRAGEQWLELKPRDEYDDLVLLPADQRLTDTSSASWSRVTTFGFVGNGTIIVGASDGTLQVAPRRRGGRYRPPERFLIAHSAALRDHAASKKWLVTAGADQIIRLWFLQDVEQSSASDLYPALSLFVGTDDEWVIWSQSGYYNASQRGDRRFGYHVNRGPDKEAIYFSSDRFIKTYFRPDIIQAIVECGSEERALAQLALQGRAVATIDVSEVLPPIVELAPNGIVTSKDKLSLTFTVETLNRNKPASRVWIVRNEQFAWESRIQKGKYKVSLPLLPGRNRIKILAENESAKSPPITLTIMGPKPLKPARARAAQRRSAASAGARQGTRGNKSALERSAVNTILGDGNQAVPDNGILYLLAVGVSDLKKPRPDKNFNNLHFAHEDAIAIYNAFAREKLSGTLDVKAPLRNKAFRSVEAAVLLNKKATKKAIFKAVDAICARIKKRARRRGAGRDVLLVFLSGHGVRRTDPGTHEQDLYFWNYDLNFDNTGRTGLSLIELGRKITAVPADVILATDACHSGMAGSDVVKGLDPNELAQRIYAINERGMYILNAARSQEVAREFGRKSIQHGIFTKSILETLQVGREVNMLNLIASVQERVQRFTDGEQTPVCRLYGDLLPLVVYQK